MSEHLVTQPCSVEVVKEFLHLLLLLQQDQHVVGSFVAEVGGG